MPTPDREPAASLTSGDLEPIFSDLRETHAAIDRSWPGDPLSRQPVHTVYGGAQLFRADTPRKLGALAIRALDAYAPDATALALALGWPGETVERRRLAETVRARVADKLQT